MERTPDMLVPQGGAGKSMTFAWAVTLLALPLTVVGGWNLYRVPIPDYPGAQVHSDTASVIVGKPPPGTPYRHESPAEVDVWRAPEALTVTHADRWQAQGLSGEGVKVAVFDIGWNGAGLDMSFLEPFETRDCGLHTSCEVPFDLGWPEGVADNGAHGIACAEIVREVAPGVDLYLVRTAGMTSFENAVNWAIREEVDLISMSMSFYNTSFYDGQGPFRVWMDRLAQAGVLLVTSSGNNGRSHWSGSLIDANSDRRMDLDGEDGLWTYQTQGWVTAYLNWDQHERCGETDLALQLMDVDDEPRVSLGLADEPQVLGGDGCEPIERLRAYIPEDGWYRLEVLMGSGASVGVDVDILVRSGSIYQPHPQGSLTEPAVYPGVLAVGAVEAQGYLSNDIQPYSSWGPTNGGLSKPDLAGPDGLTSSIYGPAGFYGTSASAPVVAGLLALVLEQNPGLTPHEAGQYLRGWAWRSTPRLGDTDPRWGSGKARLPVDARTLACGGRPLVLPFLWGPLGWMWVRARRRRKGYGMEGGQ
jgi:subtilisin family serine protease